jgi:4-oxalocrotonate tautomerase
MPTIPVEMFKGRTREQMRQLVKELTDGFIRAGGGKPESLHIVIGDVNKEDWGPGGVLTVDKHPE